MSTRGTVKAELIKLGSVRSPWWLAALGVALPVLLALNNALADIPGEAGIAAGFSATIGVGILPVLALGAVSVTSEYRYSTIRVAIAILPNRTALAMVKLTVVGCVGGLVGLLASFGSLAVARAVRPDGGLDVPDWQALLVSGPVYAVAAVYGLAIGLLLRHTAAAVGLALTWVLPGESTVQLVPGIGEEVGGWMPFVNALDAISPGSMTPGRPGWPLEPWGSLGYFAAVGAALMAAAVVLLNRRDA